MAHIFSSIRGLIDDIDNIYQKRSLMKIIDLAPENQMYMINYEINTDMSARKRALEGEVTVLGGLNTKGVREEYKIKLYKPHSFDKGSFWCSCPDHKFNSTKKKMVCKHICFVVCKVAQIMDASFFETKNLSEDQFLFVKQKLETTTPGQRPYAEIANLIIENQTHATMELFKRKFKDITDEDICPICYDGFDENEGELINTLSCPLCKNYVHSHCINVWLERSDTCICCRSTVWRQYKEARHM
jgi:hypothetical protein